MNDTLFDMPEAKYDEDHGSVMYFGRCACGCKTHPYMSPERAIDAWNAKFDKAKNKEG